VVDFINQVDEEVRAEEMRGLVRKWLPWAIGAAVLAIVVTGGVFAYDAWRDSEVAKASLAFDRGMKAASAPQPDRIAADRAFTEAAKASAPAYKSLALMERAGLAVQENRIDDAVKLFDEAAKAAPDPIIEDAALLKAAYLLMETAPYAQVEARLKPLAEEGRPYRPLAREAMAMAKLGEGRIREARTELTALSLALDAPEGMQQRAKAAIQMIDSGAAARLPAIARAARSQAASPTPAAPSPFAPQAGAPAPQAGAAPQ